MKIGLISDTHSYLDPKVLEYFQSVDEIWHAGDIGEVSVTQQLQQLKPLRAVYGNIDDKNLQALYPEDLWFDCEGLRIWITHIAGSPPNYNPRTKKILKEKSADVLVCGHSHILKVVKDPKYNLLYINPGAAGNHGFHHIKTIMRFDILNKEIKNMEVIELGKRGKL
jgi:uncharacterized protein